MGVEWWFVAVVFTLPRYVASVKRNDCVMSQASQSSPLATVQITTMNNLAKVVVIHDFPKRSTEFHKQFAHSPRC
jgi:hypothetical protein